MDWGKSVGAAARSWMWLSGPAAAVLFSGSLLGFAAARTDGYSHATKAVSELGAVGAPMAWAFNVMGFILPGALVVVLGTAMLRVSTRKTGPALLVLSGFSMMGAGIFPADMADLQSPSSVAHLVSAMLSGFAWAVALPFLARTLREVFALGLWATLTPWFAMFLAMNIGWQVIYRATQAVNPGWGQRIAFLGLFLWVAITGVLLWRKAPNTDRASQA